MAVQLTGTAGIFTRVGTFGHLLNDINTLLGTTVPADVQLINNQYILNEPYIDGMAAAVSNYQGSASSIYSWIQQTAQNTVIQMVNTDIDLPDAGLETALNELIRQMNLTGAVVRSNTISLAVTPAAANTTDAVIVGSLKSATGVNLDDCYAETVEISCTADAIIGGATLGEETLQFAGGQAQVQTLSYLWPYGSGESVSLNAINASGSVNNNGLSNGGFDTWTVTNTPDDWTIVVGTVGVTILKTTAHVFVGTAALEIVGNGSQLTCIQQVPSDFDAVTQFAVNFWLGLSGSPAAGVLQVALVDHTGAVYNDQSGTANSYSINLTAIPTAFTAYQSFFRNPLLMPSGATLQFKLTTALTNGVSLYLDMVGWTSVASQYDGGPKWAAFSGSQQITQICRWTSAISNNRVGNFQGLFQRLFDMNSFPLLLPASGSGFIPDTY